MPTGFTREELRSYARGKRARVRERAREDRRDPVGLGRAGAQGRHAARGRVRRLAAQVLRRHGQALRDEGAPHRPRPLRPRPEVPDRHDLQPPRRAAGRGAGLADGALRLRREGDRYIGRGTTDDKGPAITALFGARYAFEHGASRQHPLPLGARGGDRQPATSRRRSGPTRTTSRPTRSSSPTPSGSRARARRARAGLRGLQGFRFELQTGETDQHSGTAGGAARNPVTELCAAHRRVRGRQDRPREDPRLLLRRRAADEEGARGPEEVRLHGQGLQAGPPLPLAARQRRARGDEAHLDDADLRGPRHRRRLPGTRASRRSSRPRPRRSCRAASCPTWTRRRSSSSSRTS